VLWQLIGEGLLDPAARVVDLWPEFGTHGKAAVTLEHLLLFTAGFPNAPLELATIGDRDARARQIEQWTLESTPGTTFAYHGLSAHWVMAELVMRVTDTDHRLALRERVLEPLGLERLELGVPVERQADVQNMVETGESATVEEIATALGFTEIPPALRAMFEQVATTSSAGDPLLALELPHVRAAGLPGGGAVSDAASLALFYQHLLHDPKSIWDPEVLEDVTSNVRNTLVGEPLGVVAMRTWGLEVQGNDATARFRSGSGAASPATFGHGGAGGQIAWADPVSGLSFAYLTNGLDRHAVRAARRVRELAAAAAACVSD
jgi:CubicO group peptidase (beta-lactamase class C family)